MPQDIIALSAVTISPTEDIALVAELARRIWPTAYDGILTPEQIANMLERIYNRENLAQEIAKGHRFWIAYDRGEPAGYASAYRESDEIIWLKKIYVLPDKQGKGIGRQLTQTIIEAFPARELRLLANPNNAPAHAYYTSQGFAKIGEVPVRMGDHHFIDFMFSKPLMASQ